MFWVREERERETHTQMDHSGHYTVGRATFPWGGRGVGERSNFALYFVTRLVFFISVIPPNTGLCVAPLPPPSILRWKETLHGSGQGVTESV